MATALMQTTVVRNVQKGGILAKKGPALPVRIGVNAAPRVRVGAAVRGSAAQAEQPLVVKVRVLRSFWCSQ
jgi:hypothetical protein